MKYNRLREMQEYIMNHKTVTHDELQKEFKISIQTLRRDLYELEKNNLITKFYGGVEWKEASITTEVNSAIERENSNVKEKLEIGKLAASLIEDNDVIFVDSGTTACNVIPYLSNKRNVTVITHSLHVINALSKVDNIKCICLGGSFRKETQTFFSDTSFYPYNYNKAFISLVGMSLGKGLTNTEFQEGVMKQHVMQHSEKIFVVADHTKFDVVAFNHFGDFTQIHGVVTDQEPKESYMRLFETLNIQVIYKH